MKKGEIVAGNIKNVVAEFQWGSYIGRIYIQNTDPSTHEGIYHHTYRFVVDINRWATEDEIKKMPINENVQKYVYSQKFKTFWEASKLFHYLESTYKTPELVEQYELQQQAAFDTLWEDTDVSEQAKELANV